MTKIHWESYPQLDKRLLELSYELGRHLSGTTLHERIARTLTTENRSIGKVFTVDAVRNRLKRISYEGLGTHPPVVLMPNFQRHAPIIKGREDAPKKQVRGMDWPTYLDQVVLKGETKTLVLSDLHIPTQQDDAIDFAVVRNLTADLVILNGDILDLYSVSSFVKRSDVPLYEELDGAVRFFEWISRKFKDSFIILTRGNHETRLYTKVLPHLPDGLEYLANLDLLDSLTRPFANMLSMNDWFVSVGDAVYAHSDATASIPGKPAQMTGEWFVSHYQELDIPAPPRFVVQAHTHRVSAVYTHNMKCVESGCLCGPQEYSRTTKYRTPQGMGYVVALQYDGVTDLMNSREYALLPSEFSVDARSDDGGQGILAGETRL